MPDDEIHPDDTGGSEYEITIGFSGEWAQLVRRLGAQLSIDEGQVVATALRHLDILMTMTVEQPIVIERNRDGEIDVGKLIESEPAKIEEPAEPSLATRGTQVWRQEREGGWTSSQSGRCAWGDLVNHPNFDDIEVWHALIGWRSVKALPKYAWPPERQVRWRLSR